MQSFGGVTCGHNLGYDVGPDSICHCHNHIYRLHHRRLATDTSASTNFTHEFKYHKSIQYLDLAVLKDKSRDLQEYDQEK